MKMRTIKPRTKYVGCFLIKEWERGVLLRFGESKGMLNPGLHLKFPRIDEIKVVDMKSQDHSTDFTIITRDRYDLEASTNARYRVENPELAVIQAPENFEGHIDKIMQTQGSTKVCKNMTLQQALENRDTVGQSIENFLQEQVKGWGIDIERVLLNELTPPAIITRAAEVTYGAEVEAEVYKLIKGAEVEVLNQLKQTLGDDVIYALPFIFSQQAGEGNRIAQNINRIIEARGKGDAARVLAGRIDSSPSFVYAIERISETVENSIGVVFRKASTLEDLDEKLKQRLYPRKQN